MSLTNRLLRTGTRAALALPAPLLRRIAGAPVTNDRGDALDLHLQALLSLQRRARMPMFHEQPVPKARAQYRAESALGAIDPPALPGVSDREVPGASGPLRARLYDPGGLPDAAPLLLYLHGGGFVIGDLKTHDIPCRTLAKAAACRVLAIDYRLAPEHPWPAAPDDVLAVWQHVHSHAAELGADPERVVIGGDSAGGNLSAVTCLRARDAGLPLPAGQLLLYPGIDFTRAMPSHQHFAEGFFLSAAMIDFFMDHYAADERDPGASPWFADSAEGLPPAAVITAGFDPLRDEGEAWAGRLRDAGVPVRARCEAHLIHGFIHMDGISPACADAVDRLAADLRALFAGQIA